jgi:hypothetical protein
VTGLPQSLTDSEIIITIDVINALGYLRSAGSTFVRKLQTDKLLCRCCSVHPSVIGLPAGQRRQLLLLLESARPGLQNSGMRRSTFCRSSAASAADAVRDTLTTEGQLTAQEVSLQRPRRPATLCLMYSTPNHGTYKYIVRSVWTRPAAEVVSSKSGTW